MAKNPGRVLLVDDSRVMRAMLAGYLKDSFETFEESDGESAWRLLTTELDIVAVISDIEMPRLNGFGLLERVRNSRSEHMRGMPFLLISGDEDEETRARARNLGVSDFVGKSIGAVELQTRLERLLQLSVARSELEDSRDRLVQDPQTGLFTRKFIELQLQQALSHVNRHGGEVSLLLIGFDRFSQVQEQVGPALAGQIGNRFARLLAEKIRKEDSLGHYGPGQFAAVSPGTSVEASGNFAQRVRKAVDVGHIVSQGQRIPVTVSIGVAHVPTDNAASAGALLELAAERMNRAMAAGGNQVMLCPQPQQAPPPISVQQALDYLRIGQPTLVRPHLPELGRQLLPLIELLNQQFGLNLDQQQLQQHFGDPTKQK